MSEKLNFPKHTGIREASLLLVKEKCGRYTLIREPLYLDRCVVCSEADWDDYFEVQEISSKDTFIFKVSTGMGMGSRVGIALVSASFAGPLFSTSAGQANSVQCPPYPGVRTRSPWSRAS